MNEDYSMREATKEERESVRKYVESISKPTGVNFYDLPDGKRYKNGSNSKNSEIRRLESIIH